EVVKVKVSGVANPDGAESRRVEGLNLAARNAQGLVEYSFEAAILKPVDLAKANGTLVYEVTNRGNGSISLGATSDAAARFYMDRGYVLINSAWQGEVALNPAALNATLPIVRNAAGPLTQAFRQEIRFDSTPVAEPEGAIRPVTLLYPTASTDKSTARLYVRQYEEDAPTELPPSSFDFVDANRVQIRQAAGYDNSALYDLTYTATNGVVSGLGLASVRDLVSFLRFDQADEDGRANPLASAGTITVKNTIAYGVSQSGRFLRVFLWQGFNEDARGRRVFDGLMPIVAGARKGDFNRPFAIPTASSTQHAGRRYPDNGFPFAYPVTFDPVSGKTDGLLALCERSNTCPRIMHFDTDGEMGSAFSWMLQIDTLGDPIVQPDNVRLYFAAGLQHGPGPIQPRGCFERPVLYPQVPFRNALFLALDRWVKNGTPPPASRYPNKQDGTLVSVGQAQAQWPRIPGFPYSSIRNVPANWDYSPLLAQPRGTYPVLTTRLDPDGNQFDGVVFPLVAVPVATATGHYFTTTGYAPGEQCTLQGILLPFARTEAERAAVGDPRPSLGGRYPGGQAQYTALVTAASNRLVGEGFLLAEDVPAIAGARLPQ
ncbi:alpha/beta hydrolase domain-containing protein, partial [uncultured Sphingomonas sp.]|uniref:alpha/beta hydrolase domain-containing protein n=1 Tax=uncultured Sphingomonas sp. TaxID=158754 RepID=UPI0035CB81EE